MPVSGASALARASRTPPSRADQSDNQHNIERECFMAMDLGTRPAKLRKRRRDTAGMRHSPQHAVTDPAVVRRLIAENPWATLVSHNAGELVASHYPVLLDERDDGAGDRHPRRPSRRPGPRLRRGARCC